MSKLTKGLLTVTLFILGLSLAIPVANAYYSVRGHYRNTDYGTTYVEPHIRSEPNDYTWDNLGSDGIDVDGDGYGAGESNWGGSYDYDYDYNYDYDYGYDSYDTYNNYNSYDYDSGFDSYDSYDSGLGW